MKINAVQNNLNFRGYIRLNASEATDGKEKVVEIDTDDIIKISAAKQCPYSSPYIETIDKEKFYTNEALSVLLNAYNAASKKDSLIIDISR